MENKHIFLDLLVTPGKDCIAHKTINGWTWDDDWYACYKSRSQDSTMSGDSGEEFKIYNF